MRYRPSPQTRKTAIGVAAFVVLAAMNGPAALGFAEHSYHQYKINQPGYKAMYGHWDLVDVPKQYRINSIHAALLHTGKVLLIAGSGNNEKNFRAGTFQSVLWDPVNNTFKEIPTPKDMFCGGHAQLPDGQLLVAGGTARYEKLQGDVKRAGGAMVIKNESPDRPMTFPKGTVFRGSTGKEYASQLPITVPAATKTVTGFGPKKKVTVTASEARVYVESVRDGEAGISNTADQYRIVGLKGDDARNHYGLATKLGLDKKDFQGLRESYLFDPESERYVQVTSMSEARWYPTLVTLADNRVMAVSGLDDMGQIIPGKNEIFDPATRRWSPGPTRYFPTYPALFLTKGGKLFYSGSNAGYGPADQGRTPGVWDPRANTFTPVPGLHDPDQTETSASVLLPPAQRQSVMILGGGGVGESHRSTGRTAVVDLGQERPRYEDGPDLPQGTRYLNAVLTPDDSVFTSGGSLDYRGKEASDVLRAQFYDPAQGTFRPAAAPTVGRDYHSEALLLPDGRIAVFGSNPLFADKANTEDAPFEQRIEVYSPPYLYGRTRPELGSGPVEVERGQSVTFRSGSAGGVRAARLMRPSAVTHVTDVEQRSIALDLVRHDRSVTVTVPRDPSLVPSGWYMLFLTDRRGTPSQARWVHVR
ncbi:galactose oxidase early set domain-containing protein [Streptomyces silvisoli]|uniref:Galactose oxidase early set domain-containing protein n=1 Tax=Streptomyces silvisoli TaxID=3034235 RepID=A0ABT5ZV94_9ACTN|nr:galactose oxidase early set domain-containing protein [Streptomyces silvisoli]MDF3293666.1 galactose oxidase early set domain-containing protein [Streptomyces silvisoli]